MEAGILQQLQVLEEETAAIKEMLEGADGVRNLRVSLDLLRAEVARQRNLLTALQATVARLRASAGITVAFRRLQLTQQELQELRE